MQELTGEFTREGRVLSLLMLDLDYFKQINDQYGHDGGDACLKVAGRVIKQACRTSDSVYRIGGEEFAAVLPNTDLAEAVRFADWIRISVERACVRHDGHTIDFTCSIGAADVTSVDGQTDLVRAADQALYEAKNSGRNRVCPEVSPTAGANLEESLAAAQ